MKDLEDRFAEVEQRVKNLIADNAGLRKRVAGLERDLAQARREAEQLRDFHGKRVQLREKVERVLHTLESLGGGGA